MQYTSNYNLAKPDANDQINPLSREAYNDNFSDLDTLLKDIEEDIDDIQDDISDLITILYNLIVPVGSVLCFTNDTNPNDIYQGTTWQKIEGRFLLGSSSDYVLGSTGGSADAVVVSHTHTANNNGQHQHYWARYDLDIFGGPSSTNGFKSSSATTDVLTQPAGDHTHTINNAGESGVGKNMPPYEVVNYWKRTA